MVFPLSRLAARMRAIGTEQTGNERKKVMRIVLIGISHWHTPFYSDPVLRMKNATIVGVSDPGISSGFLESVAVEGTQKRGENVAMTKHGFEAAADSSGTPF